MPNVYEVITDRICAKLAEGVVPWRKPWATGAAGGLPANLKSGREYRGVNVFMLAAAGFGSRWWVTYKQAQELGGHVRKGEKGFPVVFWANGWTRQNEATDEKEEVKRFVLRYFTLFSVEQCDGLTTPDAPASARPFEPIAACAAVVEGMPRRPEIRHGEPRAYYRPSADFVNMPRPELFDRPEEYHGTLFHELTHATGHASRIGRNGVEEVAPFGSAVYSHEELIAEMGAAFLCGHCGIAPVTLDNSAAYLAGWLKTLRADARMLVIAGAQAQKAADFILGRAATSAAAAETA